MFMTGLGEGASEPLSSVGMGGCDISSGPVNVFDWGGVMGDGTVLLMALKEDGRTTESTGGV